MNPKHIEKLLNSAKIPISERESITARLNTTVCKPARSSYDPLLDAVIESYWAVRKSEMEQRNLQAEGHYIDFVCGGVLGSFPPDEAAAAVLRTLPVLAATRSAFIRQRALAVLRVALRHHADELPVDLKARAAEILSENDDPKCPVNGN